MIDASNTLVHKMHFGKTGRRWQNLPHTKKRVEHHGVSPLRLQSEPDTSNMLQLTCFLMQFADMRPYSALTTAAAAPQH